MVNRYLCGSDCFYCGRQTAFMTCGLVLVNNFFIGNAVNYAAGRIKGCLCGFNVASATALRTDLTAVR